MWMRHIRRMINEAEFSHGTCCIYAISKWVVKFPGKQVLFNVYHYLPTLLSFPVHFVCVSAVLLFPIHCARILTFIIHFGHFGSFRLFKYQIKGWKIRSWVFYRWSQFVIIGFYFDGWKNIYVLASIVCVVAEF